MMEKYCELGDVDPEEFNVLNHGDCWCNNIMFKYNESGEREDTILVDFQMGKYGTPCQDLLYFIFSSVKQEIRLKEFDFFIRFYHENLKVNLKLLDYKKPIPNLSDLHIMLLKRSGMGTSAVFGTLALALLDLSNTGADYNLDNLISTSESGFDFKLLMYTNPKYVKCLNEILPWLENRGMLNN